MPFWEISQVGTPYGIRRLRHCPNYCQHTGVFFSVHHVDMVAVWMERQQCSVHTPCVFRRGCEDCTSAHWAPREVGGSEGRIVSMEAFSVRGPTQPRTAAAIRVDLARP